jgi:hypothetical protein
MKKNPIVSAVLCLALGVFVSVMVAGCCCPCMKHGRGGGEMKKAAMTQSVYACPDCHTMAMKAGLCPMCKKDMQQSHLLGTKDGQALVCACGAGCNCDVKGAKDGKCACGKDVVKVSARGMYVCPMGCPEISDKPGMCACGMEMKKVE